MNLDQVKLVGMLVGLLGMGGLGGWFFQRGQEAEQAEQMRVEIAELSEAIRDQTVAVDALREDVNEATRVACEALGFESILDDCP